MFVLLGFIEDDTHVFLAADARDGMAGECGPTSTTTMEIYLALILSEC
ncbi:MULTISPECIES: hypothetical protein [unclassified Corynebacterium]|nr:MULTISPECIES: hypothetical protein [unclassified Corynebacterium]MCG7242589.1 hypothetical protein [Corynebacterium sp. ACRPS]MCG7270982.1 hypothetical protein [Corynebacterium sp. ACRQM]MDK8473235.1 hypothetical protein [Corynebacterium sp. MSK078]MDK8467542.1 hypothetical protein [Corynebacterium sp. MSK130]MDK8658837.1 hypothetical protein [Corynebacterium sp. MSK204]